ncbi:MAG: transglycosylase SLT domain-containing protein [Candidatus Sericytochromatia bacterium]|uniref:Transglycosylase SLT domain-containing protein n=1 Tax=Candidatus Tanganyikabacteria bacterium TaxID=2961651 RepID=A0A937X465_9BACT|nr:transglycosylase SLT domain-containing protein [Candidatus Tanganyikabacteria bacterium]
MRSKFVSVLVAALIVGVCGPAAAKSDRPVQQPDALYHFVKEKAGSQRAPLYTRLIREKAAKYKVPPMLVANIIATESNFDPRCRTGPSMGLMQVNHGHARKGHNLYDPATNIEYGCKILREYRDWAVARLPKSADARRIWELTLTAYNWGPTRAVSRGLYRSRYSDKVMRRWSTAKR